MTIRPATEGDLTEIGQAMLDYFSGDLGMKASGDGIREVCEDILRQQHASVLHMDVVWENEALVGFVIYQRDTPSSDWCEREGWGFIRELYVARHMRGRGVGEELVRHAEQRLEKENAVKQIYLTAAASVSFWQRVGYHAAHRKSCINSEPIYEKQLVL